MSGGPGICPNYANDHTIGSEAPRNGPRPPSGSGSPLEQAMDLVRNSDFAKTPKGKKVLEKLEEMYAQGKISLKDLKNDKGEDGVKGRYWDSGHIEIDTDELDPYRMATTLVHEATHALGEKEEGAFGTQAQFYGELNQKFGFHDGYLHKLLNALHNGTLYQELRKNDHYDAGDIR